MTRTLVLDPTTARITLRTHVEGLFARMGHDLEISAREIRGGAKQDNKRYEARVAVVVAAMKVVGVVKGKTADPNVLKPEERAEIEKRLRTEVLGAPEVVVEGFLLGTAVKLRVMIDEAVQTIACEPTVEEDEGVIRIHGACTVSLKALGITAPKGPMSIFKVADAVDVTFDVRFAKTRSD